MRIFNFSLITLLIGLSFLACESEEPLTVNEAALQSQRNGINLLNQGEDPDTTIDNKVDTVVEIFSARISGIPVAFSNIDLNESNLGVDIEGKNVIQSIRFELFNDLQLGDVDLGSILNKATYVDSMATTYNAFSGTLTVDTLNSKLLTARFFFSAASTQDTISISDGFLRINR